MNLVTSAAHFRSPSSVIHNLGGVTKVASYLELPVGTVSAWKSRGSIPVEHWL